MSNNSEGCEVKEVISWQEGLTSYCIYWCKTAKALQEFKKVHMDYLTDRFGGSYKLRASAVRHCTAIGTHIYGSSSGYMFQITQTLRT